MSDARFFRTRRRMTFALGAVPLALSLGARAQSYPSKPIKLVIGYTPGGAGDTVARVIAQKYSELLNQSVIVENKPGASATLAAAAVANARPDGYTLLVNTPPDSVIAPITMKDRIQYSMSNFVPVGLVVTVPTVLIVLPTSPYKTVDDVVKAAKANPGKLNYASFGVGSASHMAAELLKSVAGIDVTHVPFKGSSPAMVELLGGRVDFLFDTFPSARGQIEAGKVRALGVTSSTRVPVAKGIPTMEELGYKGCIWQSFIGVLAPAGTPTAVIERLERETAKMNEMPDVQQKLLSQGLVPTNIVGKQYGAFITAETERTTKLIRDAKLKLES